jgi:probable phosphoglycerate mutase
MTRIILIRHGETDTAGKSLTGRAPGVHLNQQGKAQAQNLAKNLASLHEPKIFSSPIERTMETACEIAEAHNITVIPDPDFIELNFGDWTNKTIHELKNDINFKRFNNFRSQARIPGGESMAEAQLRIIKGIDNVLTNYFNETILIVSHADMIKAALIFYLGMSIDLMQRIEISPASMNILDFYEDSVLVRKINQTL